MFTKKCLQRLYINIYYYAFVKNERAKMPIQFTNKAIQQRISIRLNIVKTNY